MKQNWELEIESPPTKFRRVEEKPDWSLLPTELLTMCFTNNKIALSRVSSRFYSIFVPESVQIDFDRISKENSIPSLNRAYQTVKLVGKKISAKTSEFTGIIKSSQVSAKTLIIGAKGATTDKLSRPAIRQQGTCISSWQLQMALKSFNNLSEVIMNDCATSNNRQTVVEHLGLPNLRKLTLNRVSADLVSCFVSVRGLFELHLAGNSSHCSESIQVIVFNQQWLKILDAGDCAKLLRKEETTLDHLQIYKAVIDTAMNDIFAMAPNVREIELEVLPEGSVHLREYFLTNQSDKLLKLSLNGYLGNIADLRENFENLQ